MIDDVSFWSINSIFKEYIYFFSSQYQIFFFLLIISNHLVQLQTDQRNNNNCPHLFKTLSDCTCVHSNTIDCSYSTTIAHLPRSWRSTNHNLTSFTQTIIRFDLIHTPSIILIKTDDFQVWISSSIFFSFISKSLF